MELSNLSNDMIFLIGLELDLPDLINYCRLSKRFDTVACKSDFFWKKKFTRDFGLVRLSEEKISEEKVSDETGSTSWEQIYKSELYYKNKFISEYEISDKPEKYSWKKLYDFLHRGYIKQCKQCKSINTRVYSRQIRSPDEPASHIVKCNDCGGSYII